MRVKLRATRGSSLLHEGLYEIADAESFGRACADIWTQIQEKRLMTSTSIGALYEALGESVMTELENAQITVSKA